MSDAMMEVITEALDAAEAGEVAEAEVAPETAEETVAEAEPEAEAAEKEPEPGPAPEAKPAHPDDPKGKAFLDDTLFTPEALATPEGIAKARAAVQAREAHTQRVYLQTYRRSQAAEQRESNAKAYEDRALLVHQNVHQNVQRLRSGDANQALEALGLIMGMDGVSAYEALSHTILSNGKQAKQDPTAPLKTELQQIKERLDAEARQRQQAADQEAILRTHSTWAVMAQDSTKFPALAHVIAKNSAVSPEQGRATINEIVRQAAEEYENHYLVQKARGVSRPQALDWTELIGRLENSMRPHVESELAQTGSPDAGRATSGNPKPGTQARLPGKTVSPTRAAAAVTRKTRDQMTEAERFEDLLGDTDGLNQLLGTSFS